MATAKRAKPVHLRYGDPTRKVVVESGKGDRIVLAMDAAIRACHAHDRVSEMFQQLDRLDKRIVRWVEDNPSDVAEAVLTFRDSNLLLLVVRKTVRWNDALEDALTDLDLEVANDPALDLIRLSVLALPAMPQECIEALLPCEDGAPDAE